MGNQGVLFWSNTVRIARVVPSDFLQVADLTALWPKPVEGIGGCSKKIKEVNSHAYRVQTLKALRVNAGRKGPKASAHVHLK